MSLGASWRVAGSEPSLGPCSAGGRRRDLHLLRNVARRTPEAHDLAVGDFNCVLEACGRLDHLDAAAQRWERRCGMA